MFTWDNTEFLADKATWEREFDAWNVPMHKLSVWGGQGYTPPQTEKEVKELVRSYMTTVTTFVDKEIVYFDPPQPPKDQKEADMVATLIIYFSDFLPDNTFWSKV